MIRKIGYTFATLALAGGAALAGAAPAAAAHCVEDGSPGFSYFGTTHVKADAHDNEGGPRHDGTPGASNCRNGSENTPATDPSENAPGQNR